MNKIRNYSNIIVEVDYENCVGKIIISREEVSNSIDDSTSIEIIDAMEQIKYKAVRSVVITGCGEKYFSAGADLKKMKTKNSLDILTSKLQDLCVYIENYPLPVIAAINGYALGGGMELALACDFRIATTNAMFGLPETSIGLIPSAGGTEKLTNMFGIIFAKRIIMLGEKFNAEKALEIGFVEKVVEHENLMVEAFIMAEKIREKSAYALMIAKMCINSYTSQSDIHRKYEKMSQAVLINQEDIKEGVAAFFERRNPSFNSIMYEYRGAKDGESM